MQQDVKSEQMDREMEMVGDNSEKKSSNFAEQHQR